MQAKLVLAYQDDLHGSLFFGYATLFHPFMYTKNVVVRENKNNLLKTVQSM